MNSGEQSKKILELKAEAKELKQKLNDVRNEIRYVYRERPKFPTI